MEILNWLLEIDFVTDYQVLEFERWNTGFYYKIRIQITDNSLLYVRDYVDKHERNYSFHWQKSSGELIIRWDNAKHHPGLGNYPHHKHMADMVVSSEEPTLHDIIQHIGEILRAND